jgi:ribosome-associated protein
MGDPQDDATEPPSKSELKRQSRELQDLGQALVDLPAAQFDALPVPEDLRDAIIAARRITSHGARVRQRLYIGKLLRNIDPEPIREALASRAEVDRQRVRREHAIETWRDRLLADEPAAWTELAVLIGTENLPQLRSLVRQARAEREAARAPSAARQLFRRLRELLTAAPG